MSRLYNRLSLPFNKNGQQSPAVCLESTNENSHISLHSNNEQAPAVLVSGEVTVAVHEETINLTRLGVELDLQILYKQPFKSHCSACRTWNQQLTSSQLVSRPTELSRGKHIFPFSALVEGDHPASVENPLILVKYNLTTKAQYARQGATSLETAKNERTIIVDRVPTVPRTPQAAVSTIEPIKITARYSPLAHPEKASRFALELDGLNVVDDVTGASQTWELDQLTWHLIETTKLCRRTCEKHSTSVPAGGDMSRVLRIRDTQVLGKCRLQDGWSSEGSGPDAKVNVDFEYMVNTERPQKQGPGYICDSKWPGSFEISHRLVVWFYLSLRDSQQAKDSSKKFAGCDRVFRVSYDVVLADCAGKDVAWDAEVPPAYGEVDGGPPGYHIAEVLVGPESVDVEND
ncbi:hypothetical protein ACJ41O_006415 [Fusarium nematophilum]